MYYAYVGSTDAVPTQLLYSVRLVVSFQASRVINNSFLKKGRWIAWYMES